MKIQWRMRMAAQRAVWTGTELVAPPRPVAGLPQAASARGRSMPPL